MPSHVVLGVRDRPKPETPELKPAQNQSQSVPVAVAAAVWFLPHQSWKAIVAGLAEEGVDGAAVVHCRAMSLWLEEAEGVLLSAFRVSLSAAHGEALEIFIGAVLPTPPENSHMLRNNNKKGFYFFWGLRPPSPSRKNLKTSFFPGISNGSPREWGQVHHREKHQTNIKQHKKAQTKHNKDRKNMKKHKKTQKN